MRRYRVGAHTKTDLKVHLVWVPKYRKKALTGEVAIRVTLWHLDTSQLVAGQFIFYRGLYDNFT